MNDEVASGISVSVRRPGRRARNSSARRATAPASLRLLLWGAPGHPTFRHALICGSGSAARTPTMLIQRTKERARGSSRNDRAVVHSTIVAPTAASKRRGKAPEARICWKIGVTGGRIPLLSRTTRLRRGTTRPRLNTAVTPMWKSLDTSRRRRLQFDPLEGRQLLSGGYLPAPHGEFAFVPAGSTVRPEWVSGSEMGDGEGRYLSVLESSVWDRSGSVMDVRGGDPYAEYAGLDGASWMGGSAHSEAGVGGAPGSSVTSDGSGNASPSPDPSMQAGNYLVSMYMSSPSNGATNAWNSTNDPGSSEAASPSAPPGPTTNLTIWTGVPGGYNPGNSAFLAREQAQTPPPFSTNAPQTFPGPYFDPMRDRSDGIAAGIPPTMSVNPNAVANAPGVQALGTVSLGVGVSSIAGGSSAQATSSVAVLAGRLALAADPDAPGGDHAGSSSAGLATQVDARARISTAWTSPSTGRTNLSTIHSDRTLPSTSAEQAGSDRGQADPLPQGADLILEALPFAGDTLERSLEEFVRQLEAVDVAGLVRHGPPPFVVASVAVVSAAATAVVVREVVRRRSARGGRLRMVDSQGRELALSFPELPRSWSERY
jgi:hypothetical protein